MTKIIPQFTPTAQTVLCKRYLRHLDTSKECSYCHQKHETPEEMFERCSFGREDYYNLLASLDFLPGSPTLFNAGTNQGTFSSCFKLDVHDSMESIMDVATKSAMVQKWGGGVGYVVSEVRPYGKHIRSTHGKACGPIAVLNLYQSVSEMITQGGKRAGAQIAVLSCDHEDLKQFIHCKDNGKSLSTFNISVACTDAFMGRAKVGNESLFDEMCESAWKTGDPGIYFIDTAERSKVKYPAGAKS